MIDFLMISTRSTKRGVIEIYPKFIIKKSSDLMIRGGDFYAIWIEERGLWSTDEQDALQLIDRELDRYAEENRRRFDSDIKVLHMWDAESGMIDSWHKYCQKQMRDSFHMLDEKLIFSNTETNKKDYASKKLNYPLEAGDLSAYDKLMSVLYSEEERHKMSGQSAQSFRESPRDCRSLWFYMVLPERVNLRCLTSFSNSLTDIIRCLMRKRLGLLVILLRWKPLRVIRLWQYSMTVICQGLRIIPDLIVWYPTN